MQCIQCKKEFTPKSSKAQYCSGACKVRAFRTNVTIPSHEKTETPTVAKSVTIPHVTIKRKYDPDPKVHGFVLCKEHAIDPCFCGC